MAPASPSTKSTPIEDDWERISEVQSVISLQSSNRDNDANFTHAESSSNPVGGEQSIDAIDDVTQVCILPQPKSQPCAPSTCAVNAKLNSDIQLVQFSTPMAADKRKAEMRSTYPEIFPSGPCLTPKHLGSHQTAQTGEQERSGKFIYTGVTAPKPSPSSTPLTNNNLKMLNDSFKRLSLVSVPQEPNALTEAEKSTNDGYYPVDRVTSLRVAPGHQILEPFRKAGKAKGQDADPSLLHDLLCCLLDINTAASRLMPNVQAVDGSVGLKQKQIASVANLGVICRRITVSLEMLKPILSQYGSAYERLKFAREEKLVEMEIPLDGSLHIWMNKLYEQLQALQTTLICLLTNNPNGGCVAQWSDLDRYEGVLAAYQVQMQTYMAVIVRDCQEFFLSLGGPESYQRTPAPIDVGTATWPLPIPMELKHLRDHIRAVLIKVGFSKLWLPSREQKLVDKIVPIFREIAARLVGRKIIFRSGAPFLQLCGTFCDTLDPTFIRDFALQLEEISSEICIQGYSGKNKGVSPEDLRAHVERVFIQDGRLLEMQSIAEILQSTLLPGTPHCECAKRAALCHFNRE